MSLDLPERVTEPCPQRFGVRNLRRQFVQDHFGVAVGLRGVGDASALAGDVTDPNV